MLDFGFGRYRRPRFFAPLARDGKSHRAPERTGGVGLLVGFLAIFGFPPFRRPYRVIEDVGGQNKGAQCEG